MSLRASKALSDKYREVHWGIEGSKVWEVDDPRLPDELCEMGKLKGFVVIDDDGEMEIEFKGKSCSLTFTLEASERVYPLLDARTRREMKALYDETDSPLYQLSQVADHAGGRQAGYAYPNVRVKVLGELHQVYYHTNKKGDGPSLYVHEFGEDSGIKPYLCVSSDGWLWVAGGNFTVPEGGITD